MSSKSVWAARAIASAISPVVAVTATVTLLVSGCSLKSPFKSPKTTKTKGALSYYSSARSGPVQLDGQSLRDSGGNFNALGATLFSALRWYKFDRERLNRNLSTLSDNGYSYIRILAEVDWAGREIDPRWPDYKDLLAKTIDLAFDSYGIRTHITVFGSAKLTPTSADRRRLVDTVLEVSKGREEKILLVELVNEGNFPDLAEQRSLTRSFNANSPILVATGSGGAGQDGCDVTVPLYEGGIADVMTVHLSRDTDKAEGAWRPARQPWNWGEGCNDRLPSVAANDEPIGPGSSVNSETDPQKLVAAAITSFQAGMPCYTFHSRAGIGMGEKFGFNGDQFIDEMPGFDQFSWAMAWTPADVGKWRRSPGNVASNPVFQIYSGGQADTIWPVTGAGDGVVRANTNTSGQDFFTLLMGVKNFVKLVARVDMAFYAVNAVTGEILTEEHLHAGESATLRGAEAILVRGLSGSTDRLPAKPDGPAGGESEQPGPPSDCTLSWFGESHVTANVTTFFDCRRRARNAGQQQCRDWLEGRGGLPSFDLKMEYRDQTSVLPFNCVPGTPGSFGVVPDHREIVQQVSDENPGLISSDCAGFLQAAVSALQAVDPNWGYCNKAGAQAVPADIVMYRQNGTLVDIVVDSCSSRSTVSWQLKAPNFDCEWRTRPSFPIDGQAPQPPTDDPPTPTSSPTQSPTPTPAPDRLANFSVIPADIEVTATLTPDDATGPYRVSGRGHLSFGLSPATTPGWGAWLHVEAPGYLPYDGRVILPATDAELDAVTLEPSPFSSSSPAPSPAPAGSCKAGSFFEGTGWATPLDCLRKIKEGTARVKSCDLNPATGCYGIP